MITRLFIVLFVPVLFITACKQKPENADTNKLVTNSYENGNPEQVFLYNVEGDDTVTYAERNYYEGGELKTEGNLDENSERHGTWIAWYRNGNKWQEASYDHGLRNGEYTVWHENGQIKFTGMMENDERKGSWLFFNEAGEQKNQVDYP